MKGREVKRKDSRKRGKTRREKKQGREIEGRRRHDNDRKIDIHDKI